MSSFPPVMSHPQEIHELARFKQQFYVKLLDHFWRLYSMVANYASKDDNDFNEEVIEDLEHSIDY